MKIKIWISIIAGMILVTHTLFALEARTYRQFKDVSTKENGKVTLSNNKGDLFEITFVVDIEKNTITRTKIRRLDQASAIDDETQYIIIQKKNILASEAGNGGKVFIATNKDGSEIIELGHRYAFTTRTSPFSQVITGVYKRVHGCPRKVKSDQAH